MKAEFLYFEDLTEEEQGFAPDNGIGKEDSEYLRIKYSEEDSEVFFDAMESEDAIFSRDLSWIKRAIEKAYNQGLKDAIKKITIEA